MEETDFLAQLQKLQQDFAQKLPDKLADIDRLWQQLARDHWPADDVKTLHRAVHSITGSGRTFGLAAVSDAARAAELALAQLLEQTTEPSAVQVAQIEQLLAGLRQAASGA